MTITIGRASITEDPETVDRQGDSLSFSGEVACADLNELKARMQQLQGLETSYDEAFFPLTWSEDSTLNGYYQDITVRIGSYETMLTNFVFPVQVTANRVSNGYAHPRIEVVTNAIVRTNSHGVTAPTTYLGAYPVSVAWPLQDVDYSSFSAVASVGTATRVADDTTLNTITVVPVATTVNKSWRYWVPASEYYFGSCKVEVKYGSTWYPVVGNQIPGDVGGNWRLSNGVIRVYPAAVASGGFTVETFQGGSTWTGRDFKAGTWAGSFSALNVTSNGTTYVAPTIIQNSPHQVALACQYNQYLFTFILRRGHEHIEIFMDDVLSTSTQWGVTTSLAVASTTFTGGVRATANDANGQRMLLSTPNAKTDDLVNGRIWLTAAVTTGMSFQVTNDYQSYATDTAMRDRFLGTTSSNVRVAAR